MSSRTAIVSVLVLVLALTACAEPPAETSAAPAGAENTPPAADAVEVATLDFELEMANAATPIDGVLTGGQPSLADLETLAAAGYKTVVNLRQPDEPGQEGEAEKVAELGMAYVAIPVAGADGLSEEAAHRLSAVLDDPDNKPLLLHCGSSNRVGALLALEAAWVDGVDPEDALALGKSAGLTRLEPDVRERLGIGDEPGSD